jgi:putative mycofactocin binding protein MftB
MVCLADSVQVRKESWGLLFYSQTLHKLCFVRSGHWLEPEHFNGAWSLDELATDIAARTKKSPEKVRSLLEKLTERLKEKRMVVDELR